MAKKAIAKLFRNGRSQAVRLPREFRFEGDRVFIRRVRNGVLLEPIKFDTKQWFAEIDHLRGGETFMTGGRNQPKIPRREMFK